MLSSLPLTNGSPVSAELSPNPDTISVYVALLDTISDSVIYTDLQGRIRFWNTGAVRIFGYPPEEMLGRTVAVLYPQEDPERLASDLQRILSGQDFVGEWRGRRRDGSSVFVEVRTTLVRDASGRPIGFLGVAKDIGERKHAETVLRKQEILEAVARLAGGVAHESNNQMSVVLGLSSFILQREDLPESLRQDVNRIHAAAERTAAMTRELLAFSRKQLLQPRTLHLNSTIEGLTPALRLALGDRIELQLRLAPGLPPIRFDQRQLEQVLLHLVVNARDAMPDGGSLSLVTRVVVASEPLGSADPVTIRPGRYVELVVRDSGRGMDTETLTHVFEPFYTTKEMGLGAGLSLASVYGIVKQSGGYVFAESSPGQGTRFRILLPAAATDARSEAPPAQHE